jgi:iduronate 2-sulfatase
VQRELYDHAVDDDENDNVAERPENVDLVRRLSDQLAAGWRRALPPDRRSH